MRPPRVLSLEDATTALEAAEALRQRWADEAAEQGRSAEVLAAELAETQARAADDLLDDDDPDLLGRISADLDRRRTSQGLAVQAAVRAGERLIEAQRGLLRARGGAVRSRAASLQLIATERRAKAELMLADLLEFEGVSFGPVAHRDPLGVAGPGFTPSTLTQRLENRAKWLHDHAAGQEHLAQHGSNDQVVSAVAAGLPPLDETELALVSPPSAVEPDVGSEPRVAIAA